MNLRRINLVFLELLLSLKKAGKRRLRRNVICKAECDLTSINIKDKVGNRAFLQEADGLGVGIYKWLTVKAPLGDYLMFQDMLTIIVEPNTSGKSRKLYVHFDSGWKYGVIEVKQE